MNICAYDAWNPLRKKLCLADDGVTHRSNKMKTRNFVFVFYLVTGHNSKVGGRRRIITDVVITLFVGASRLCAGSSSR